MHTYCRWRNAHPRDYKIDDDAMLRFVLLLAASPLLVIAAWIYSLPEVGRLIARRRFAEGAARFCLTPFFMLGEAPGYFRARWLQIAG